MRDSIASTALSYPKVGFIGSSAASTTALPAQP